MRAADHWMSPTTDYYMLVASLPRMPRTFDVEQPPITRQRLAQRMKLLSPDDARIVDQVEKFLVWDRQPVDRSEEQAQREHSRLIETIGNPMAKKIISYRMGVRTIMSAIRRRRLGMSPPAGVAPWAEIVRKNWDRPDFRLGREHPWILPVIKHLDAGDPLEVQKQLLSATWKRWTRLADNYFFSLEAVLLYWARWEIVDRWTRLSESAGREKFDALLTEALGDHADFSS